MMTHRTPPDHIAPVEAFREFYDHRYLSLRERLQVGVRDCADYGLWEALRRGRSA